LTLREKLIKWGVFSVVFALVPFGFAYGNAALVPGGPPLSIPALLARGGLLLVAVGLATGAIGDLIGSAGDRYRSLKLLVGGLCATTAVMASLFCVVVSDAYTSALKHKDPLTDYLNIPLTVTLSAVLYVGAVVSSGACIALADRSERSTS
jgi:hypothetical protein